MGRPPVWVRWLASAGAVAVWAVLWAPMVDALALLVWTGEWHYDSARHMVQSPPVILGGVLLLVVALRTRTLRGWTGGALAACLFWLAVSLGLSLGAWIGPSGAVSGTFRWTLFSAALACYSLSISTLAGVGALLTIRVWRRSGDHTPA